MMRTVGHQTLCMRLFVSFLYTFLIQLNRIVICELSHIIASRVGVNIHLQIYNRVITDCDRRIEIYYSLAQGEWREEDKKCTQFAFR
jgi:hypothetical protein